MGPVDCVPQQISADQPAERKVKHILVSVGDSRIGRPFAWALLPAVKEGRRYRIDLSAYDQLIRTANTKR